MYIRVIHNSITLHCTFVSHTHYNHLMICFCNTYFLYIKILKQFQVSSLSKLMTVYADKYQAVIFLGIDAVKFGSYLQCFVRTSCLHLQSTSIFEPEDGSRRFFRIVANYLHKYGVISIRY
jgi:hypothetical protein